MLVKDGYWRLEGTGWEAQWTGNKTIEFNWINKFKDVPGGELQCYKENGVFGTIWMDENKKERSIFLFNANTTERWLQMPGWYFKDQWGNVNPMTNTGHNFQIGTSEWNFDWWMEGIAIKSRMRNSHQTFPAFTWEGNGTKGLKFSWREWFFFKKTIEIFTK